MGPPRRASPEARMLPARTSAEKRNSPKLTLSSRSLYGLPDGHIGTRTTNQTGSSPRARRYYADDDGDVARRHSTATDRNVRRVTLSMLRMILCPFPDFFRFPMTADRLLVDPLCRYFTRVTISLYRRHPLAASSTILLSLSLSRWGSRARGSTGVVIGEKKR